MRSGACGTFVALDARAATIFLFVLSSQVLGIRQWLLCTEDGREESVAEIERESRAHSPRFVGDVPHEGKTSFRLGTFEYFWEGVEQGAGEKHDSFRTGARDGDV